jgi:acetyltransferase
MLCDFAERSRNTNASERARIVPFATLPVGHTSGALDETQAKACLGAYGIRTPRRLLIDSNARLSEQVDLTFPVAVKIVSPDIVHKTEAGGVRLQVSASALEATLTEMRAQVHAHAPEARMRGFLLEEMAEGVEMIVGALNNPSFGPLVVIGLGGIHAEVFRDVTRRYAPLTFDEARAMILSLKGARLLQGYRGAAACDIDALAETAARLSWMIVDHADTIAEIEMNPVLVGAEGRGVTAVDAVIRFK